MNKQTHIDQVRSAAKRLMGEVCELLEIDDMKYSSFMYRCGLRYIELLVPEQRLSYRKMMEGSKTFWGWWKLHC